MFLRTLIIFSVWMGPAAWAQTMWGTGVYGGMQGCAYNQQPGQGAVSEDDDTREAKEDLARFQAELKKKKDEKKKIDKVVDKTHKDVENSISADYADFIFDHMENNRQCAQYQGLGVPPAGADEGSPAAGGTQGGQNVPQNIPEANMMPVQAFSTQEWGQICDRTKAGSVNSAICSNPKYMAREGRGRTGQNCKKSLVDYRKNYNLQGKLADEIDDLTEQIKDAKVAVTDARKAAAQERKEATEGGVCIECLAKGNGAVPQQPQTNWASVIGNVGVGLASIYSGYKTNKMISENNANLGWPSDPYASVGYGYGLGAIGTGLSQAMGGGGSGIYGAMNGGMGQGGFGCAGTNGGPNGMMGPYGGMNGQGMWGNPYAMQSMGMGMGGGMFNQGMGPWGNNGYNMMNPYGNMGYVNMMGGVVGNSMLGGTMMSSPLMGSMLGGSVMGYGSMMGGSMLNSGYGNMLGGSMMGYGMMMGSMTGTYGGQYQQQLMQLQMQQYQQQMQRYQTVSSLQQEMYQLMYRIQQVQSGSTGYLGGSIGSSIYGTTYGTSGLSTIPTTGTSSSLSTISTGR